MNPEVETNIVFIDPTQSGRTPKGIVAGLAEHGVRMGTSYGGMIRAVTHLDVTSDDMEIAAQAFTRVVVSKGAENKSALPRLGKGRLRLGYSSSRADLGRAVAAQLRTHPLTSVSASGGVTAARSVPPASISGWLLAATSTYGRSRLAPRRSLGFVGLALRLLVGEGGLHLGGDHGQLLERDLAHAHDALEMSLFLDAQPLVAISFST